MQLIQMKELRQETFIMKFMNINEMEINKWEALSVINELRYVSALFSKTNPTILTSNRMCVNLNTSMLPNQSSPEVFPQNKTIHCSSGSTGCHILREIGHFIACLHFWALRLVAVHFPKHHVVKTYRSVGGKALPFLNSLLYIRFFINAPAYLSPQ
jgi:hypothetical protein